MPAFNVFRVFEKVFSLAILISLLCVLGVLPAAGQDAMPQADALIQNGARISYHAQTGKVRFIGMDSSRPISPLAAPSAAISRQDAARGFLATYGSLFGLTDSNQELIVHSERPADQGRDFVRFQQVYQGIPVFGGEMIVQLDAANELLSANGEILPDISVSTTPTISAAVAQQSALQAVAKKYGVQSSDLSVSQPELWIYNPALVSPDKWPTRLVWRMDVEAQMEPIRELVLIDAQRGSVALSFNQIDTILNLQTYTANNTETNLPGSLVCNTSNPTCTGGDSHAVAAHTYAGDTYDFYFTNLGRDSIDNAGMTLVSTVHFGTGFDNAFWNGRQMVYGDAFGYPLADDVVGHELTHGVTEYESSLFYFYQSGAINESLSDVFGEFVDLTNGTGNDSAGVRWLIGEDVSGSGALRNMADPTAFSDPDKMTSANYYLDQDDNGGVHFNSGINNKAAYLMTDGDSFNAQTITGLGIPKVTKIYYEVQTHLLTSGADYADLFDALYQGCLNLVGTWGITSGDCQQVRNATLAVEMNQQPVANFNTDAPLCPTGSAVNSTVFFDDLESGPNNWITDTRTSADPGRWYYGSPYGAYAHSGLHFLYADDYPDEFSDSYVAMSSGVTLPANAYLHFAHAYAFEPSVDGGVVEYNTGSSAWNSTASLFEVNGYDGTLDDSNPIGVQPGFKDDSHGYISSRLNLSSLAGQTVRFRWRMGTNEGSYYWGWWLDDVRIYTCAALSPAAEITVESLSTNIADGGSLNLGTTTLGTPLTRTITVRNIGTPDLTLSTAAPSTTGDFTASNFGATTLASNISTTFYLTCNATSEGAPISGTVSFGSNDSDENPFNFAVTCTVSGSAPGAAPLRNYYTTHTPTLTWNPLSNATTYELQIANNSSFTNAAAFSSITGITFTPPSLANGTYYWRLRVNGKTTWSAAQQFVVAAIP